MTTARDEIEGDLRPDGDRDPVLVLAATRPVSALAAAYLTVQAEERQPVLAEDRQRNLAQEDLGEVLQGREPR